MIAAPTDVPAMHPFLGRIALIMPIYNEAAHLWEVLASIAAQRIERSRLYLIVVDGPSTDDGARIVREWLATTGVAGLVLQNPRRSISTSLNLALAHCLPEDLIVRLDGHTTYGERYLADILTAFATAPDDVACVGGPQRPELTNSFSSAVVAALLTNPVGLGGADFRKARIPRYVDSAYLGAWKPGVLQAVGGFNEAWHANEDSELNARLGNAGLRTWWWPLETRYRINRSMFETIRQWGRYGYWRAATSLAYPSRLRMRHYVPSLTLAMGTGLAAVPLLRPVLAILYAAYAAAIIMRRAKPEPPAVTAVACAFFPACQAAYGLGFSWGLLRRFAARAQR